MARLLALIALIVTTQGCMCGPMLGGGYSSPRVVCDAYGHCAVIPMAPYGYAGGYGGCGYGQVCQSQVPAQWDFPTNGAPFVPGGYTAVMARERWLSQNGYK